MSKWNKENTKILVPVSMGILVVYTTLFIFHQQLSHFWSSYSQASAQLITATAAVVSGTLIYINGAFGRRVDRVRHLNERYAIASEQLGNANYASRLGAAFSLESLANDWYSSDSAHVEQIQACIDLLTAYLNSYQSIDPHALETLNSLGETRDYTQRLNAQDIAVRRAIIKLISKKTRPLAQGNHWRNLDISLRNSRLDQVDLFDYDLSSLRFIGSTFQESIISGVNFDSCELRGCNFQRSLIRGTSLHNTPMGLSNFTGAEIAEIDGDHSTFDRAIFNDATLEKVDLSDSQFSSAKFINAKIDTTTISKSDFTYADFSDATINNSSFVGSAFSESIFTNANITDCDFSGASFYHKKFGTKYSIDEYFKNATLTGSNFSNASFELHDVQELAEVTLWLKSKGALFD